MDCSTRPKVAAPTKPMTRRKIIKRRSPAMAHQNVLIRAIPKVTISAKD